MSGLGTLTGSPLGTVLSAALVLEVPVVAWALSAVATTGYWTFAHGATKGLGPLRAGGADPGLLPPGGREPAHQSYWVRQVWLDTGRAVAGGARAGWSMLRDRWILDRIHGLLVDAFTPGPVRRKRGVIRLATARFFGLGLAAGALAGALLAALVMAVALVLCGVLVAAVAGTLAGSALAVRVLDQGRLWAGQVRMRCPYPGCYHLIGLPVYYCPGCQTPHRGLRPGRYGILRRVCGCGAKLPTSFLSGRHRLAAACDACRRPLPAGLGRARLVHVPLIGGTSSGKTMLLLAMMSGLDELTRQGRIWTKFALQSDRDEFGRVRADVAAGGWAYKTQVQLPRAVMLHVGTGRRSRLLYLYDPKGEIMESGATMREQHYLAHSDALLLVVDVLAAPELRHRLSADEQARAAGASPSSEGPMDTYERLTGEFTAMVRRRGRTPVAVVVTKLDAVRRLGSLPAAHGPVEGWLAELGLRNLVSSLEHNFGKAGYWALSAREATGPAADEAALQAAAEPILWLLRRSGLRVKAARTTTP